VAWADDGRLLVSVGDDGLARVWSGQTGEPLHAIAGHTAWIESVACGAEGLAVTAGGDRSVRAWDVRQGKLLRAFAEPAPELSCISLSPNGKLAATGGTDGRLRLWDVEAGKQLAERRSRSGVAGVAFSRDGGRLASAHRGDAVRLWDLPALAERAVLRS
jgi:WD40 repeat protein